MTENTKKIHSPLIIDLNQFKLCIDFNKKIELTLHFNSPSRRFYLSVIAFVVNEMKRLGRITSIPLEGNYDVLVLLNDTVGGSAGSSKKENLLPRIYRKWKDALPNLEEAPLFKVLGRTKKYDDGAGKTYAFSEAEKDNWANLFEYTGSEDKVRLKFAIDRMGAGLNDIHIIYEDSVDSDAWDMFLSSLKGKVENIPEIKPVQSISEIAEPQVSPPKKGKIDSRSRYRWKALLAVLVLIAGVAIWVTWEHYLKPARFKKASMDRMAFPLPDKPSIAVMPFINLSDDKSQEYFSDGLTEDLITDLSRITGLFVIARNSAFMYKGKSVDLRQISRELGVKYVLEGSVRRAGDQLRINAQLLDASTGQNLWAERYDGNRNDVFTLQDKINQKIVAALAVKLTADEMALVAKKETTNLAAYEEFLKGREHYLKFAIDDLAKAMRCFKRAIELDPDYLLARAALTLSYYNIAARGPIMLDALKLNYAEARLRARQYLMNAMGEPISITYMLSGLMNLTLRKSDEAISQFEKALALDPNDPLLYVGFAWVLNMSGRPAEGIEHAKSGMRLDPLNPARYLAQIGVAHFCMGESQEAVTAIEQALKLNPEEGVWGAVLASAYAHLGRNEEAKAAYEAYRQRVGTDLPLYFWPFKDRRVEESFVEGLMKTGWSGGSLLSLHVSSKDQISGQDIKAFYYPSTISGYAPGLLQWSQEYAKDGTVTFRAAGLPGGVYTGRSWLEGDKICIQFQNLFAGLAFCRTTFRNPRGTPQGNDEYLGFSDLASTMFSRAQ